MRSLILLFLLAAPLWAQERITWFGTWEAGLQQARQTGRPILLVAAAPQCHGVSGIW